MVALSILNITDTQSHYENVPIQLYWEFYHQKMKNIQIKNWYFSYSCSKHRLWRGGSNEYPQSMFLSRNKKNNIYPSKPQFYYTK